MKAICMIGVGLIAAAAWGADTLHPLDVKTGLWETTLTNQMNGAPAIPPDLLSRMTPEQRAKFEEAMKARAAQGAHTTTHQSCLTKDKLNQPLNLTNRPKECTYQVITSSSSKQEIQYECAIGGAKQTGTLRIEAIDSSDIKGSMRINMAAGDRTSSTMTEFTSKWLGAACSEKDEK